MTAILAIDCATGPISVAVWKDGKPASYLEDMGSSMQSARMLPMIERALAESGIGYKDLTSVAATVGPGSFTGIRVALSAARGICFAAQLPGLGFTTLEVVAYAARETPKKRILAALNAGKGEYYCQGFEVAGWSEVFAPQVLPLSEALRLIGPDALVAGNAKDVPSEFETAAVTFPRADALAALASRATNATPLTPFYIRPPDAIPPSKNF